MPLMRINGRRYLLQRDANLDGADLSRADLSYYDLRQASFNGADLRNANLCEAVLRSASFDGADLTGATLSGADLSRATFRGTRGLLTVNWGSPGLILRAWWGRLPPVLNTLAIALDVANHPSGRKPFTTWWKGQGYPCPYIGDERGAKWEPMVAFSPNWRTYNPKTPAPTPYALAVMLLRYAETGEDAPAPRRNK